MLVGYARVCSAAKFPFPVHLHMLRHACGFKLANDGQDTRALQEWLGHSNIQHTTRYTELIVLRHRPSTPGVEALAAAIKAYVAELRRTGVLL